MIRSLSEIADLNSGVYAKRTSPSDTLYLQASHFDSYGKLDPLVKPQIKSISINSNNYLREGDVLFAAKGTSNFAVVYQEKYGMAVASSSFIVIRIRNGIQISPEYLAWYLTHTQLIRELNKRQHGTTVSSISIRELRKLEINVPPIETQEKIVKIQELRNREKEIIRELESARENKIQQLLTNSLR